MVIKNSEFDLKVIFQPGVEYKGNIPLIEASEFEHMSFPFSHFNPMQSEFFPVLNKNPQSNFIINTPTSSGKTVLIEMLMSQDSTRGLKSIYIPPLRGLSNQKLDDWTKPTHPFASKKIAILTGDYVKDDKKIKELQTADFIIMTPEMLDVSLRKDVKSDSFYLNNIGSLIVDEAHLIGEKGRGDKLESCLMRFSRIFKDSRIALISATMPNLNQLQAWVEYLTKRNTILFKSNYRPARLDYHFLCVDIKGKHTYQRERSIRIGLVTDLVREYINDSILIFVGSKSFGNKLQKHLESIGITDVCFYNADLSKENRDHIFEDFNTKKIKVLISTSALAWGLNTPARRVFIAQQAYNPMEEFSTSTYGQMGGRAGRPPFELVGDCYAILTSKHLYNMNRIINGEDLKSQMLDIKILSFHVLSEIKNKVIHNRETLIEWYKSSFAYYQDTSSLQEIVIDNIFETLLKYGMISRYLDVNKDVRYKTTFLGDITSSFYLYPEDANALIRNMRQYVDQYHYTNNSREADLNLARVFAMLPSNLESNYLGGEELENIAENMGTIPVDYLKKYIIGYYLCLHEENEVVNLSVLVGYLRQDIKRLISFLKFYNKYYKTYNMSESDFEKMYIRFAHGCGMELVDLCSIRGVGYTLARRLRENGIYNRQDFYQNADVVKSVIGNRTAVRN